ncbi:MAG: purine-nucleoside phosphorylase [Oscillospiraceae bacterium]|nr:purine-nucleoside phosphorylase [Oscillospiraceae bacterium]
MATPHIRAEKGDIAKSILLPGDPLRAKFIAENYFENPVLFTDVRNILGYTGTYKGRRISVMGTGMGIPSISIYSQELMTQYGVRNLIRIGTAGGYKAGMRLGDVILAQGCSTTSNINRLVFPGTYCPIADFDLLRTAYQKAVALGKQVTVGNMLTSDMFYAVDEVVEDPVWTKFGIVGVEMEGAGLYTAAARNGCRALCIATVSDIMGSKEEMTSQQREKSLTDMIAIGLGTAWEFAE